MPATKLTDTQLVILYAASQREDRGVVLPTKLKGGAAQKLVAKMIDHGLIEEVRARGALPVWRRNDDNRAMALRITKGGDNLMIFGDENGNDTHCKVCGSLLYSVVRDGAFVHVAMGTLVDDPTIRPTKHIFVGSKARWFTITDDLPQYQEHVAAD